jgi:hypothetical protein
VTVEECCWNATRRNKVQAVATRTFSIRLTEQLRQACHVDGDGLVLGSAPSLHRLGLIVSRVNPDERLAVGVTDDAAAGGVGAPGRRKAAGALWSRYECRWRRGDIGTPGGARW